MDADSPGLCVVLFDEKSYGSVEIIHRGNFTRNIYRSYRILDKCYRHNLHKLLTNAQVLFEKGVEMVQWIF